MIIQIQVLSTFCQRMNLRFTWSLSDKCTWPGVLYDQLHIWGRRRNAVGRRKFRLILHVGLPCSTRAMSERLYLRTLGRVRPALMPINSSPTPKRKVVHLLLNLAAGALDGAVAKQQRLRAMSCTADRLP